MVDIVYIIHLIGLTIIYGGGLVCLVFVLFLPDLVAAWLWIYRTENPAGTRADRWKATPQNWKVEHPYTTLPHPKISKTNPVKGHCVIGGMNNIGQKIKSLKLFQFFKKRQLCPPVGNRQNGLKKTQGHTVYG